MKDEIHMQYTLDLALSDADIDALIQQFHFAPTDKEKITSLYRSVHPLLTPRMYYLVNPEGFPEIAYKDYALCVVTLGSGIDELTSLYLDHNLVSEPYILDCIGLKLLSNSYRHVISVIAENTNLQVEKLDFLGDTYPLSLLPEILSSLSIQDIHTTDGYMMIPMKSVCMLLPLTAQQTDTQSDACLNICSTCPNLTCTNRQDKPSLTSDILQPHSYGYQRIFGNDTPTERNPVWKDHLHP